MRKVLFTLMVLLTSSCTTSFKSPITYTEYKGEIAAKGVSLTAKPPFWKYCCDLYQWAVK